MRPRGNDLILEVIGSKVKVRLTKRSKTTFGYNSVNISPMDTKPTPKCAELCARSGGMSHLIIGSIVFLAVGGQRSGGS